MRGAYRQAGCTLAVSRRVVAFAPEPCMPAAEAVVAFAELLAADCLYLPTAIHY